MGRADERSGGRTALRFDRQEWSGAIGDMGTDLPLLVGMIIAARLDAATVFLVYGALQVATGLAYRMPMPVQPLKAVAAIVIAGSVSREVLTAGGFAIGALMLVLALTGGLAWLQRIVPIVVVRGIQIGLGLQLGRLALERFVPQDGPWGLGASGAGAGARARGARSTATATRAGGAPAGFRLGRMALASRAAARIYGA